MICLCKCYCCDHHCSQYVLPCAWPIGFSSFLTSFRGERLKRKGLQVNCSSIHWKQHDRTGSYGCISTIFLLKPLSLQSLLWGEGRKQVISMDNFSFAWPFPSVGMITLFSICKRTVYSLKVSFSSIFPFYQEGGKSNFCLQSPPHDPPFCAEYCEILRKHIFRVEHPFGDDYNKSR